MASEETKIINQPNIDAVQKENNSDPEKEFVFTDGRLVSPIFSKILCFDLTDKYQNAALPLTGFMQANYLNSQFRIRRLRKLSPAALIYCPQK